MADASTFAKIKIGIASPEEIRAWSYGEVKKPETINYRTFKPERDGLFCERIFGPVKDWECHCGRYKKVKYKGIICERCGVEVTRSKVRRERMGHIELAAPVCHIWYLKGVPSPLALILDISPRPLEKVLYFAPYIVTEVDRQRINTNLTDIRSAVREETEELQQEKAGVADRLTREFNKEVKLHQQPPAEDLDEDEEEYEYWDEETVAQKQAYLVERIKQEERDIQDRIDELAASLTLLEKIEKRQLITEDQFRAIERLLEVLTRRLEEDYSEAVRAGLGGAAIKELLQEIDLEKLSRELRNEIANTQGPKRARAIKRLEITEAFIASKARPEWMILDCIPVISPELRPMVQLDGGRFATSDLNDLYRRIINRNNRLKKITEIRAPESIVNHEKRLLQEAVDALIDNGRRTRPVVGSNNRPLRSLSDMLKGKEGRFRKNLLGKRVDYSGRSVIVVGPHLKLHQCGLPKEMALELFKPFVMKTLVERGYTSNIKTAKRMIDKMKPEVWDALEEVIREHPVLLNRAPTLHRLGIQAFEPILVEGKAIQVHPLVCHAFNADFDGDQMAVHVPLSAEAQAEARILMLSSNNILSPASGRPLVAPTQDMVLGIYYLTYSDKDLASMDATKLDPRPRRFDSADEIEVALEMKAIGLQEPIEFRFNEELHLTTPGRVLINSAVYRALDELLPPDEELEFDFLNQTLTKPDTDRYILSLSDRYGAHTLAPVLDTIKTLGFKYATKAGVTISKNDIVIPPDKEKILADYEKRVEEVHRQYDMGLITEDERHETIVNIWTEATDTVADAMQANFNELNPVFMMANSGARGSFKQIRQLAGMRGLMANPKGEIIERPIKANFMEGLSVLEYFISTHGARKGLADTALRTADSGYLTRRLVDVSQDVIIRELDCKTKEYVELPLF